MFSQHLSAFWLLAAATRSLCANVHFEINLTWKEGAPDGQTRELIYVNGQFPGPQLTLDYGDNVEVVVCNHLPFDTSIHFHGIE